jgi:uracil-DNA glycosylase family 4
MISSTSAEHHLCGNPRAVRVSQFLRRGVGTGRLVLVLGESPATRGWRLTGRAFYTPEGKLLPSGRYLNDMLGIVGLRIESCGFTELVKCYIGGNRTKLSACGMKCWPILVRQLMRYDFRVVIVLGVRTLEIVNQALGATLRVGQLATIDIGRKRYRILPVFHPSPRNPANHRRNLRIFKRVAPGVRRALR